MNRHWRLETPAAETHCQILWDHFIGLHGKKMWETIVFNYADKPWQVVQFWTTGKGQYLVTIDLETGGWDVYGQLDTTNQVQATLEKIA
jgi:hypothetical protein